jgi:hypothetical protein
MSTLQIPATPPLPLLCLISEFLWFVVPAMNVSNGVALMREACALRHFSLKSEKNYVYWLNHYGTFVKDALQPQVRIY